MVDHDAGPVSTAQRVASGRPRRRVDGRLVVLLVVVALSTRGTLSGSLNPVALRTWTTVFVAIVVQALPFLVLGVLVSGAITALVSPAVLARVRARVAGAGGPCWLTFSSAARHDLWDAGGWLVVGAAAAATLQVLVPRSLLGAVADHPALSVLALGGLAVLLAICSEADAFVAASMREFSLP